MLPLGRLVIVPLTSCDVVHSLTLNEMRIKQDATAGGVVRTSANGKLRVRSSAGLGHYRMRGEYTVLPPNDWTRWLQSELILLEKSVGPALRVP